MILRIECAHRAQSHRRAYSFARHSNLFHQTICTLLNSTLRPFSPSSSSSFNRTHSRFRFRFLEACAHTRRSLGNAQMFIVAFDIVVAQPLRGDYFFFSLFSYKILQLIRIKYVTGFVT